MEKQEVEVLFDRARQRYFQAYDRFDRTLKGMGLSDDQVLLAIDAVQPMLKATEDRILMGTYRDYLETESGEAVVDFVSFLEASAQAVNARYEQEDS